ncbi:hypothetical protein O3G_MSEX000075 [Manduca sexta]|nr:hypothetical protein O3G_MSEX000075 [Manduca sexta]
MSNVYPKCYFGCVIDGPLHYFPKATSFRWKSWQDKRYQTWITVLDEETLNKGHEYIRKNLRLCHRHFDRCYKLYNGALCRTAIPTLNLEHYTPDIRETMVVVTKTSTRLTDITKGIWEHNYCLTRRYQRHAVYKTLIGLFQKKTFYQKIRPPSKTTKNQKNI